MTSIKRLLLAVLMACLSWSAPAVVNVPIEHDTSGVRLGYWTSDFTSAKAYADEKHVPMLAFWGSAGCGYCALMKSTGLLSDEFKAWVAKNKIVMVYIEVDADKTGYTTTEKTFIKGDNNSGLFPYMCIYWAKENGSVIKKCFTGRKGYMPVSKGITAVQLVSSLDLYFSSYTPADSYTGGWFSITNRASSRLEAVAGKTTYVNVPMYRTSKAAGTNKLQIGSASMVDVSWSANETNKLYKYTLPTSTTAGTSIALKLYDSTGKTLKSSSAINVVSEPANSISNPKWIGETFDVGEWTMDLDAALSKAKSATAKYYTLAVVGGDMWCPYCQGLRNGVLNTAKFKTWAKNNNVNLVCIDMPQKDKTTATLLTRDESTAGASGAAYLSRKMISDADAKTVFNRNKTLSGSTWLPKSSSSTRLANPTVLLLNSDKSVAGRLYAPNNGTTYPVDETINRLTELLRLEGSKEAAGSVATTALSMTVGAADATSGAMQVNDNVRWYKLSNVPAGKVTFTVEGYTGMALSAYEYSGSGAVGSPLASGTNTLTVTFTSSANKYLKVQGFVPNTKTYGTQTDCDWEITTKVTLVPSYTASTYKVVSGRVNMSVTGGVRYKLSGFTNYTGFTKNSDGTYSADKTATVTLTCNAGASVSYQISGVPGTVQFATTTASVKEADGKGTIQVTRTGGKSGVATFTVSVNKGSTNSGRVSVSPTTLTWKDGETATKTVTYTIKANAELNKDETFTITLAKASGTADALGANKTFTLKVTDSTDPMLPNTSYTLRMYRNIAFSQSIAVNNIRENGRVTVSRSGTLPNGVSLAYDSTNKKLSLSGTPKRAGTYTFTLSVTEQRSAGAVTGPTSKFTVTVADPTALNKGDVGYNAVLAQNATVYGSLPVYGKLSGTTVLSGVATLRVMRTGKVSVAYVSVDGARTQFSGSIGALSNDGTASAALTKGDAKANLSILGSGRAKLTLTGMSGKYGTSLQSETQGINLIRGNLSAYSAYYTVTLPLNAADLTKGGETIATGTGYLILRMNVSSFTRTGKVSYKGMLANGRTFSGYGYISGDQVTQGGYTWAYLPVSVKKNGSCAGMVLRIRKNAASNYTKDPMAVLSATTSIPYWIENSEVTRMNVYGGVYDKNVSFASCCEDYYDSKTFTLVCDAQWFAASSRYGAIKTLPSVTVKVNDNDTFTVSDSSVRLTLAKATGLVSGRIPATFANGNATMTVRGVVLPGWADCGCGETSTTLVTRPLFSGAAYYNDRGTSGTIRRGIEVYLK